MIQRRYWLLALLIAVSLHAAGFVVFLNKETDDGAELAGEQGIEIDLGMIGDLGETEETEPEAAPEPISEPEPEPVTEPEPEVEPAPEPEPEPVKQPEPVKPKQQTDTKVKKLTEPAPKPKPQPIVQPEPDPELKPRPKPLATQAQTKDVTPKQAKQKQTTGKAAALTNGGQVAARQSYFSLLAATLAKHKRYPSVSRRRGEEGIVKLFFVVDRSGEVLEYRISESSGSKRLDEAVLKMLDNASPLPAFPADMSQQQLEVNVPIAFQLNT